jgi:2-polyprenyl-3-methyl-5-hydroxy-6-metoxy-1,4-benzoquinol methylase
VNIPNFLPSKPAILYCQQYRPAEGKLCVHGRREAQTAKPLLGLSILDVGCGGGLFSEALARLGATTTGIDASDVAIGVARVHARSDPLLQENTTYRNITAEQAVEEGGRACSVTVPCQSCLKVALRCLA